MDIEKRLTPNTGGGVLSKGEQFELDNLIRCALEIAHNNIYRASIHAHNAIMGDQK